MTTFIEKARRLLTNRMMMQQYFKWVLGKMVGMPKLHLPGNNLARIVGFQDFSEFWGTYQGLPSKREIAFIKKNVSTDDLVIDIGGNIGVFTVSIAIYAPESKIKVFEPTPKTFEKLKQNVKFNCLKNVEVYKKAVSDSIGNANFLFNDKSPATNRLDFKFHQSGCQRIEVELITLDVFCESNKINYIDFLKIDVEGAEPRVLGGAAALLKDKKIKCILIEICPANLKEVGSSVKDIIEQVVPYGYGFFDINNDGSLGKRLTVEEMNKMVLENVVIASL